MTGVGDVDLDAAFWTQVLEDRRRTFLCSPGRLKEARQLLADAGLQDRIDVQEAEWVGPNQMVVVDHHAFEACVRQSRQARRPAQDGDGESGTGC